MNSSYLLNFVIPQGPTGPTGPTGPASGLAAYGGKYSNTAQTLNLGIGTQTQVALPNNMPNLNTTYIFFGNIAGFDCLTIRKSYCSTKWVNFRYDVTLVLFHLVRNII